MGMDSGQNSHTNRRVPVAKDGRDAFQKTESISRRRRWSEDEKARIVEESLEPGTRVCDVAKRHSISRGMVFEWRRQAKAGEPRQDAGRSSPALLFRRTSGRTLKKLFPLRPEHSEPNEMQILLQKIQAKLEKDFDFHLRP